MGENRQELGFETEIRKKAFLAGQPLSRSDSMKIVTDEGLKLSVKVRKLLLLLRGDHSAGNIERQLRGCISPADVKLEVSVLEKVHALLREWSGSNLSGKPGDLWEQLCVVHPSVAIRKRTGWFLTYDPALNRVSETRVTSEVRKHESGGLPFVLTEVRDPENLTSSFTSRMDEEDVDMYMANGHSEATARCAMSCVLCEVCSVVTEFLVDAEEAGDFEIKAPRPKDLKRVQQDYPALMCTSCSLVVHVECLGVAFENSFTNRAILHQLSRTKSDWFCPVCLASKKNRFLHYGYQLWPELMTRKEYEFRSLQVARRFKIANASLENVENTFWAALHSDARGQATVLYASDLDSAEYSSGPFMSSYHKNSSWELRALALSDKSVLKHLEGSQNTKGVTVPWLYLGSHLSAFCWHAEDQYLCSISYLHDGAPKVWYSVPGHQRALLEQAIAELLPDLAAANRDLQHHLTTMVDPLVLKNLGIDVSRGVQRGNEFIVTFPEAYHCGFNTGINLAEAVNVAFPSWIAHGLAALKSYALVRRPSVFCLKELSFRILQATDQSSPPTLSIDIMRETIQQAELLRAAKGVPLLDSQAPKHDICADCYQIASFINCLCTDMAVRCLACAINSGTATSIRFRYRYDDLRKIVLTKELPCGIATPKRRGRPRKSLTSPESCTPQKNLVSSRRSDRLKRPRN